MKENFTISKILEGLKKREFSAKEICQFFLEKIKKEDGEIKAFISLNEEEALNEAKKIDKLLEKGKKLPPLAGVPCAIKDNILVEGLKCTAGSQILKDYIAPFDATVVKKLKEAGAIILGKTNLDEFAMGSSTENSAFFKTKNPLDPERVPGGSSGGSAAAVAANFCVFALGSDTGGSIRQPASFCAIVGLKPTYGMVSRFGLIAFASSLDQIGPMTKDVKDCEKVFDIIKGEDKFDSTSVKERKISFSLQDLKIGIPKEFLSEGLEEKVEKEFEKVIKFYQNKGFQIFEISLPHAKYALPCYYIIAPAEASSNLARYDCLRYGKREIVESSDLFEYYLTVRNQNFGPEVKRRILLGTFVLSVGYYEAFYKRAQKVRKKIFEDFQKAFEKVDLVLTPTSPTLPFKFGEKKDPLQMYLSDIFTVPANLAGLPAISIPIEKKPIGLQIIAPPFYEKLIFEFAKIYEREVV